jgi:hypothetical protein
LRGVEDDGEWEDGADWETPEFDEEAEARKWAMRDPAARGIHMWAGKHIRFNEGDETASDSDSESDARVADEPVVDVVASADAAAAAVDVTDAPRSPAKDPRAMYIIVPCPGTPKTAPN